MFYFGYMEGFTVTLSFLKQHNLRQTSCSVREVFGFNILFLFGNVVAPIYDFSDFRLSYTQR